LPDSGRRFVNSLGVAIAIKKKYWAVPEAHKCATSLTKINICQAILFIWKIYNHNWRGIKSP